MGRFPAARGETSRLQSESEIREQNVFHTPSARGGILDYLCQAMGLVNKWLYL
jgi:hypothetical protein